MAILNLATKGKKFRKRLLDAPSRSPEFSLPYPKYTAERNRISKRFHFPKSEQAPIPLPPPTGLSAVGENGEIVTSIDSYDRAHFVNWYLDGTLINTTDTQNAGAFSYTYTGLNNGQTYTVKVTIVDSNGIESPAVSTDETVMDTLAPSAPTGLTVNGQNKEADMSWDANSESDLAGYNVYVDGIKENTSLITGTTYTVSGLNNRQSYDFNVTAVDNVGNESALSSTVTETISDTNAPSAPTGLSQTAETTTSLSIDWDDNTEDDIDGYNVYVDGVKDNGSLVSSSDYQITGLTQNTTYDVYVTAVDLSGNESNSSTTLQLDTTNADPAQPSNLTISEGDTELTANWDANSEHDLAGYNVYLDGVLKASLINTTSHTFTGLTNGQQYTVEVEAEDTKGATSTKASATGTPALQEVNNYSAEFDGVDDYVEVTDTNNSLDITGDFTMESWVYPLTDVGGEYCLFIAKRGPSGDANYQFWVRKTANTGEWSISFYDNSTIYNIITTAINVNQWSHVSIVRSGTDLFAYVDGSQVGSLTNVGIGATNDHPFFIGTDNQGSYSNSRKDDVRVWSVARTQTEIQNNMSSELTGSETGLLGYWKLNEGLPLAYDKAGGNQGTVNGDLGQSTDVPFATDNRYALDLDGTDDYIAIPSPYTTLVNILDRFTIECWIKTTDTSMQTLLGCFNNNDSQGIQININENDSASNQTDEVRFYVRATGGSYLGATATLTGLTNGNWHHVAFVRDGDNSVKIYLDGVSKSVSVYNAGSPTSFADWEFDVALFARNVRGAVDRYFNGKADDFRVWDGVRSQTEIQNNYQSELNGNEQGLVDYWTFDEYAEDLTANNNHGLLKGNVDYSVDTPFVKEFTSHSLSFDGADDYTDVGTGVMDFSGPNSFTVDCWIKTSYASQEDNWIIGTDLHNGWYMRVDYSFSSTYSLLVKLDDGNNDAFYNGSTVINDGEWHHIAMVVDGNKGILKGYIDGKVEIFVSQSVGDMNDFLVLGGIVNTNEASNRFEYNGLLDEPRVWNKALTGVEIRDSMKKDLSDLTNVVGYWKHDEGSGTTAIDETGNNNGTINGATYSTDTPD